MHSCSVCPHFDDDYETCRLSYHERVKVCPLYNFEYGTDADFDRYSVEVQNGEGYYNEDGKYVSYHKND